MHTSCPVPRPKLEHWLRGRNLDYSDAGRAIGCSRETIRRYCLPFSDPKRRFPNKWLLPKIVTFTGGDVTGHHFIAPPDGAAYSHSSAGQDEVAA